MVVVGLWDTLISMLKLAADVLAKRAIICLLNLTPIDLDPSDYGAFFMSIVKNLAPGVDMTLLMRSLTVSRSAVDVPASNG